MTVDTCRDTIYSVTAKEFYKILILGLHLTYKWYIIGSQTNIAGKIRRVFVIGIAGAIKNEGFRDSLSRDSCL